MVLFTKDEKSKNNSSNYIMESEEVLMGGGIEVVVKDEDIVMEGEDVKNVLFVSKSDSNGKSKSLAIELKGLLAMIVQETHEEQQRTSHGNAQSLKQLEN